VSEAGFPVAAGRCSRRATAANRVCAPFAPGARSSGGAKRRSLRVRLNALHCVGLAWQYSSVPALLIPHTPSRHRGVTPPAPQRVRLCPSDSARRSRGSCRKSRRTGVLTRPRLGLSPMGLLRVIELDEQAVSRMLAHHDVEIVAGAPRSFEEAGALERVAGRPPRACLLVHRPAVRPLSTALKNFHPKGECVTSQPGERPIGDRFQIPLRHRNHRDPLDNLATPSNWHEPCLESAHLSTR
jgi:hypothetical protein